MPLTVNAKVHFLPAKNQQSVSFSGSGRIEQDNGGNMLVKTLAPYLTLMQWQ